MFSYAVCVHYCNLHFYLGHFTLLIMLLFFIAWSFYIHIRVETFSVHLSTRNKMSVQLSDAFQSSLIASHVLIYIVVPFQSNNLLTIDGKCKDKNLLTNTVDEIKILLT